MGYPSDLSDKQWAKIEKFFERPDPRGARSKYPKRRVVEAILYRLREGCRWRALPHDFPPYDTVFDHWQRWSERGVWQEAVAVLGTRWPDEELGRARRAPKHAILDSQRVKTAAEGEERGFHGGKKIKGRSRHVAIDSQGTLLAVHVCAANKADGAEAGVIMVQACERHPSLESFTANGSYQRQAESRPRANSSAWTSTSPPNPRGPSLAATGSKRGLCPRQVPLAKSSAPSLGLGSAACSARSTKRPSKAPKHGSGVR